MNEYKFSDLSVKNSDIKLIPPSRVVVFSAHYEKASWKYVIISMVGYALQPIILPIMILLSKVLKRKIEWFPIQE